MSKSLGLPILGLDGKDMYDVKGNNGARKHRRGVGYHTGGKLRGLDV